MYKNISNKQDWINASNAKLKQFEESNQKLFRNRLRYELMIRQHRNPRC